MRPQGSLAVFANAEMPRKRSYLANHHRHHLHGRIMMHFSLSWQTTHNLSSLSRSTSLSSWNVMFDQGSPPRSSPDPLHYQCYPSSSCQLSPQPADNSSSSSPASPSRPLSSLRHGRDARGWGSVCGASSWLSWGWCSRRAWCSGWWCAARCVQSPPRPSLWRTGLQWITVESVHTEDISSICTLLLCMTMSSWRWSIDQRVVKIKMSSFYFNLI